MKNFEIVCLHMWESSWLDKMRTVELNPWTLDRSTSPKERRRGRRCQCSFLRRPHDRSNQKHKQESDNERKPFNRRTANSSPSAPRQSTPRDKKPGSDETKQSAGKKKRLICFRCGGKGHPARLCPSGMIDRTWMKSEQSRQVMLTVICLVWIGTLTPLRPSTQ